MVLFDREAVERLRRLGGDSLAEEMITLFLEQAPARSREAEEARRGGDLRGVAFAVHSLKSSAAYVGAAEVRRLAGTIEKRAREGDSHGLEPLLSELLGAVDAVCKLFKERKEGSPR